MACRRETRRFLTASPRGPEGQARLTGRRSTSLHTWKRSAPQRLPGVLGGEQGQTSGRVCQESTAMTWGLPASSRTCLPFSPGPLSPCCPPPNLHFSCDGVIHLLIHSTNIY